MFMHLACASHYLAREHGMSQCWPFEFMVVWDLSTGDSSGKAASSRHAGGLRTQSLGSSVPSAEDDDKVRSNCVMRRMGSETPSAGPQITRAPSDEQPGSRSSLASRGSARSSHEAQDASRQASL